MCKDLTKFLIEYMRCGTNNGRRKEKIQKKSLVGRSQGLMFQGQVARVQSIIWVKFGPSLNAQHVVSIREKGKKNRSLTKKKFGSTFIFKIKI